MKKITENESIYLRELLQNDFTDLCCILRDEETMYAYEAPFTEKQVQNWLVWNLESYQENGFGLWAIIDKKDEQFVGQCGIVYSKVEGKQLLEIGYLVNKHFWNQGFASQASNLCIHYAKTKLKAAKICSIIRESNLSSRRVAEKNGMTIAQTFNKFYSGTPIKHFVYSKALTNESKK